ncbi:transcriptional regulator, TetR family [Streptomyces sp. KS_5]|nr:transcriptional regulator, TetR family [Streptomyces sp. KS_5]
MTTPTRGRGARDRVLAAALRLFYQQGINATGVDQLAKAAQVSKRSLYQHFDGKDGVVREYLRLMEEGLNHMLEVLQRADLSPRERLLGLFDGLTASELRIGASPVVRGCPFVNAAVEAADPHAEAHELSRRQKLAFVQRVADAARDAGVRDPVALGQQLVLLYDGASAHAVIMNSVEAALTARDIAAVLIDRHFAEIAAEQP